MINYKEGTISVIWSIDDVRTALEDNGFIMKEGKDLSDKECMEVLVAVHKAHDCGEGISWQSIIDMSEILYEDRFMEGVE